MQDQIEAILKPFRADGYDAGCEQCGPYWQVWIGSHGGGRADGVSLARELAEKVRGIQKPAVAPVEEPKPAANPHMDKPEPVEIPAFLREPDPRLDLQAARIAELEAMLAAAAAPKPEPVESHIPPPELADIINVLETPEQTNMRLTRLFAEAKQGAELARTYGGVFNGKSIVDWERKAERYESGLRWNRGRFVETI